MEIAKSCNSNVYVYLVCKFVPWKVYLQHEMKRLFYSSWMAKRPPHADIALMSQAQILSYITVLLWRRENKLLSLPVQEWQLLTFSEYVNWCWNKVSQYRTKNVGVWVSGIFIWNNLTNVSGRFPYLFSCVEWHSFNYKMSFYKVIRITLISFLHERTRLFLNHE